MSAERPAVGDDGEASACCVAPLIHIPPGEAIPRSLAEDVVRAFRNSGFLRITTPLVSEELQNRALDAATKYLESPARSGQAGSSPGIVTHPADPKRYAMLITEEEFGAVSPTLAEYRNALESAKVSVLRCLATGLGLSPDHLSDLHSENNSSLRLLRYPAGDAGTGNRCREHSDYGSVTLLLTDGVSGLEAYLDGRWVPVPHSPGSLVVNAGSLLEVWTGGRIPATLHRVAGPASVGSVGQRGALLEAVGRDRTSIAFFADPDRNVSAALETDGEDIVGNGGGG